MKFKDVKIGQRFRFVKDPKTYLKESNSMAVRGFIESYIFQTANVELVDDNEKENDEEVDRRSMWQQRLKKN